MRQHIRATPPFGQMRDEHLAALEAAAEWKTLRDGEQLFGLGDEGDAMYIVATGTLQVLIPGKHGDEMVVAELGANDIIGEIQLLTGGTRTATVRAVTPSRLIGLGRSALDRLTATTPTAVAELNTLILRRLRRNQLAQILASYFGVLSREQLEEIQAMGEWVPLAQGEALFRQGDEMDSLYVLVNGSLGVLVRQADGSEKFVGRVRTGELVGETSLLTDEPPFATIYAIREAELVRFPKREILPLLERHPRFLMQIARMNINRLKAAEGAAESSAATTFLSLLPTPGTPLGAFAAQLAKALAAHAPVLHLSSANIDLLLRMPGVSQAPAVSALSTRFSAWLSAQEGAFRYILLETDATDTNWTNRCIRQSDQVITVGVAGGDPSVTGVEATLDRDGQIGSVPRRLVLLHPMESRRASGTAQWLQHRPVEMHHHVREGNDGDLERLARFLTGNAVCLALGGGGARGFAHIGAYQALHEAGVPIDIVGGTSMGAVIGAEIAAGFTPDRMRTENAGLFSNFGLMLDLTLPLLSITTGKAYATTLRRVFGDVAIEDLWIPYFCVSSNISHARMSVHRTGLLREKLRASSGVQGLFPPVVMDGALHVDGALFSNLPADVMKSVCRGKVIAVDVTPPVDLAENSEYGDTVSGWKVLWSRLLGGEGHMRFSDLGTVMQRSAEAASMANQRRVIRTMADYYLLMPVQHINLMNFAALPRLCDIGYSVAKEKLDEWQRDPAWVGRAAAR